MSQPIWNLVQSLGDVDYMEGGAWLFVDSTEVYDPEVEVFEDNKAYRFSIDKCTYINGVLSDNPYHTDKSAWWDSKLVADFIGMPVETFIANLCGDDLTSRACMYMAIGQFYGYVNLDSYPLELTEKEASERYNSPKYIAS